MVTNQNSKFPVYDNHSPQDVTWKPKKNQEQRSEQNHNYSGKPKECLTKNNNKLYEQPSLLPSSTYSHIQLGVKFLVVNLFC